MYNLYINKEAEMEENNEYSFIDENGNEVKVKKEKKESKVNIGKDGIHIKDGDTTVDIGRDGIHVNDGGKDRVDVENGKATVNGKEYDCR